MAFLSIVQKMKGKEKEEEIYYFWWKISKTEQEDYKYIELFPFFSITKTHII